MLCAFCQSATSSAAASQLTSHIRNGKYICHVAMKYEVKVSVISLTKDVSFLG